MNSPSVSTDGIQVVAHQGEVPAADAEVGHAEAADQLAPGSPGRAGRCAADCSTTLVPLLVSGFTPSGSALL